MSSLLRPSFAMAAAAAAIAGAWLGATHTAPRVAAPAPAPASAPTTGALRGHPVPIAAGADVAAPDAEPDLGAEPAGRLILEGQVVDDDDQPVGEAEVVIDARPARRVRTEGDGSFVIDRLLPRTYRVLARAGERASSPVAVAVSEDSEPLILRVRAAGRVEVRVVDDGGAPIAGAAVALRGLDAIARATDPSGRAAFAPVTTGTYVIAVDADGFAPARQTAAVRGDPGTATTATVALTRGVTVRGTVRAAGRPLSGARIVAVPAGSLAAADAGRDGVSSDGTGAWTLPAVARGHYRLVAVHADHPAAESALVTVTDRPIDGVELALDAGCQLTGSVRTASGAPAAGVRIGAALRGAVGTAATRRIAVSDDDGGFTIHGLRTGDHRVSAEGGDARAAIVAPCRADAPPLSLVLDQTATIRGTVVTSAGDAGARATVLARPTEGDGLAEITATAAEDGTFELRGLAASARYLLSAARPGDSPRPPAARTLATVAAGADRVRLVLDTGRAVRGRVVLASGGPPPAFTVALDGGAAAPIAGGDGSFALTGVAPGERRLVIDGVNLRRHAVLVSIAPDRDTDLGTIVVAAGSRLTGRVVDADGAPIAAARVIGGDQLLGDATSAARFGSDQALGTRETTSGADGSFVLAGLPDGAVTVVAEHATRGRSRNQVTTGGGPLLLTLAPTGRLDGRVIDGDRGVPGVPVLIAPTDAPRAARTAITDSAGRFEVVSLPGGDYRAVAVLGPDSDAHATVTATAAVTAGDTARVELVVPRDGVTLRLDARHEGAPVRAGQVVLTGDGRSAVALLGEQRPVTIGNVQPGAYRACVVLTSTPGQVADRDQLARLRCQQLTIADAPSEQSVVLELTSN